MINTASITDLKQNTAQLIKTARFPGTPILVMQRSRPAVVLVDPGYYKILEEALEDLEDLRAIEERKNEPVVPSEKVARKLGLL